MELVFIRHGQSEWNAKNLFTGWRDVKLSEQGLAEAAAAGQKLKEKGYHFDNACCKSFFKHMKKNSVNRKKYHSAE